MSVRMKIMGILILTGVCVSGQDWADLERYAEANSQLVKDESGQELVVFIGNSITQSWPDFHPEFFTENAYIGRGISGQTTPQMLIRFRQDVIDLEPDVVVILAGTNDIAGNTGPMTLAQISGNIFSMCELAKVNGIQVVLSSVLPAYEYPWKKEVKPAEKIFRLNQILKQYAHENDLVYLDYFSAMVDNQKGLQDNYTYDGVHPNRAGYDRMEELVAQALSEVKYQP